MISIDKKYFREYRQLLGFTNQDDAKKFFGAKDIAPTVDYGYIELLNLRLIDIVTKLNHLVVAEIKAESVNNFCSENINLVFDKLKEYNIIKRLTNQGRRPEEVYYNFMRGYVISSYFMKSLSIIFEVPIENIDLIGDDDLINIERFKRTPKADLQINFDNGDILRVEIQSGFQDANDIKQHKVLEAKKIKREQNISSLLIHFDLFNGQVAFVKIDEIDEDSMSWVTRQQMEGQTVFEIGQNYFDWKLTENPPLFKDIIFS